MAELTVNGARLAYEETGAGAPTFLFVHGWACDRGSWTAQVADLERDHRCIAVDLRGRGESEARAPFGVSQAANDLAALIEALSAGPAVVVGHSLGGIIALLLNARRPDLVLGLVTIDSPIEPETGKASPRTVARLREAGSMAAVGAFLDSFAYDPPHAGAAAYVDSVMRTCDAEVAAGMLEDLGNVGAHILDMVRRADLKPFMAIWAEEALGDPGWLRDNTMFVRQEPVAGTGHFVQIERPEVTNALLRAFLDDIERDPRVSSG